MLPMIQIPLNLMGNYQVQAIFTDADSELADDAQMVLTLNKVRR